MGEPVAILELAEELIRLSGFEPYEDMDIIFTGLRPGEKLYEELLIEGEGVMPTSHEMIRVQSPVYIDAGILNERFQLLFRHAEENDVSGVIHCLKLIVPEFKPEYTQESDWPPLFRRIRPDIFQLLEQHERELVTSSEVTAIATDYGTTQGSTPAFVNLFPDGN